MASQSTDGTGAPVARRYRRVLGQSLAWAILAVAVWLLWPASLGGGTSFVIVSGQSMEPTYASGDVVIARSGDASIGDVIVYAPSDLGGAQVVHRIVAGDESGWILQGDNNDFLDPFEPTGSEVRGVVKFHIPHAGVVTMWLLNPLLWCAVILVALVLAIWPSSREDDRDDEEEGRADTAEPDAAHPRSVL